MRLSPALPAALLCASVALFAACSGDDPPPTSTASPSPTSATATASASGTPGAPSAPPRPVALQPVSNRTWQRPTEMGPYPSASGQPAGFFVAEQEGVVYEVVASGEVIPILDLRDRVLRSGHEEGLLSVALDPEFATNRYVWAYYSAGNPRRTVLARFTRQPTRGVLDRDSQLVVLEVGQPFANHNGGAIRFGKDGMLYLGLGDGGSAGDPSGNGQKKDTLLGKIIRIDVRNASKDKPYVVPSDNPFVSEPGARGEIWATGLRNPWRMSFDPPTGALWAGDVGQGAVEEIDLITRGANYGWSRVEGDRCFKPTTNCDRAGLTAPVTFYAHENGRCSIVGGMVYRGTKVPEIAGAYVYGDTCSGEVWAINAAQPGTPVLIASGVKTLTSFGVDAEGEITALAFDQPIRRLTSPR